MRHVCSCPQPLQPAYWILLPTNQRFPWNTVLLGKLTVLQLAKNFPTFYGARRFNAVFTRTCQLSISWARSIQFAPSRPIPLKIYFKTVIPSTLTSSKWSLSFRFRHQNHVSRRPRNLLGLVSSVQPWWAVSSHVQCPPMCSVQPWSS